MNANLSGPTAGACPGCAGHGAIGSACGERACARLGMHYIPANEANVVLAQPSTQREVLVGQFVGDYLVIGRLGKGGFGKVLLGLQRPGYRLRAAVKLLEFEATDARTAAKMAEKFDTEGGALAVLQHPNIVRLLQTGMLDGRPFMAMEYIPGSRTLHTEIQKLVLGHSALEPAVVQHVLTQILNGLEAAHEQQIIHRDIKPENVMLQSVIGDPWHVKIVDFGLAKDIAASRETSMVLGTVHYMAPEQIEGKDLGPWTDCYAVGAIAFELLTGHRPFRGKDSQAILRQKLKPSFDPFESLGGHDLSDTAVEFLRRALARYANDRYRGCGEMRAALMRVVEEPRHTALFPRDLSALFNSEEIARVKSEEVRLAEVRRSLDSEWRKLDEERKKLESERVRLGSREHGTPAAVEYEAYGETGLVRPPSLGGAVAETEILGEDAQLSLPGRTANLTTIAVSPSSVGSIGAAPLDIGRVAGATSAFETEKPSIFGAMKDRESRRRTSRRVVFAGLALLVGAGVAVALTMSENKTPAAQGAVEERPAELAVQATREASVSRQGPGAAASDEASAQGGVRVEPGASREGVAEVVDSAKVDAAKAREVKVVEAPKVEVVEKANVEVVEKANVEPTAKTTIAITSTPPGAEVWIDGRKVGVTPYELGTEVGARHRVEVKAKGRAPEVREVVGEVAPSAVTILLASTPKAGVRAIPPATPARTETLVPPVTEKPATGWKPPTIDE